MIAPNELSDLLARIAAGDQDAFSRFYDATSHIVFGMVLSVVRDRTQAESVTQDVYVTAWRTAPTFDVSRRSPNAWLAALAGTELRGLSRLLSQPSATA